MPDTESRVSVFPGPLLGAFPPVYLLHLLDERFWGVGTANWATAHSYLYFTNYAWLWVNVPSMLALTLVVLLVARGRAPDWWVVALSVHLLLHGTMRVGGSFFYSSVSPGILTGVVLCVPLACRGLILAKRTLPKRALRLGVVAGLISFQPFWHVLLHPLLPGAPPAA